MPGFFLTRQEQAHEIVREVGSPHLKIQMDLYHCQIVEGDLAARLRRYLPTGHIGHVQIAGVPDRHEPDTGEINYPYLFGLMDELGYDGWIGCEYHPRLGERPGGTSAGLEWLRRARAPLHAQAQHQFADDVLHGLLRARGGPLRADRQRQLAAQARLDDGYRAEHFLAAGRAHGVDRQHRGAHAFGHQVEHGRHPVYLHGDARMQPDVGQFGLDQHAYGVGPGRNHQGLVGQFAHADRLARPPSRRVTR